MTHILFTPERGLRTGLVWPAIGVSALLHAVLIAAMSRPPPRAARPEPVELDFVEAPPPPPAPAPPVAPLASARVVRVAPRAVSHAPAARSVPAAVVPAGVSAEATAPGGSFAVAVGETLRAAVVTPPPAPVAAPGPPAAPFVPETRLDAPPRLLGRVDPVYTPAAREEGIEGEMVLLLDLDDRGRVVAARVLRGLGHGLDEAAIVAARSLRFAPASASGQPVRTQIRFTWTFLLD